MWNNVCILRIIKWLPANPNASLVKYWIIKNIFAPALQGPVALADWQGLDQMLSHEPSNGAGECHVLVGWAQLHVSWNTWTSSEGRKVLPKQNHRDMTTRPGSGSGVAKPTNVHYSQNTRGTMSKAHLPPLSPIRLERSVLVTISWCGSTRATFQQIVRLLMSAITSVIFSTSPQRLRDTSPSLRVTDLAPLLQCHFSVASMHFPHRHSTPKEQFALGRRIYKNKPQTQ